MKKININAKLNEASDILNQKNINMTGYDLHFNEGEDLIKRLQKKLKKAKNEKSNSLKLILLVFIIQIIFLIGCAKNAVLNADINENDIKEFDLKSDKLSESIFNKIQWLKIKEKNGVILYMQKNKKERNNHYKAEKFLTSIKGEKLFSALMDFNKYSKIFPKTIIYKKIKEISKNKYLMYCQANFKPFKNRDYYIILEFSVENKNNIKEWIVEWSPLGSYPEKFPDNKKFLRVNDIYGRWKIVEIDNKIKISVEYFNNFKLSVSQAVAAPFEKSSTIDTLNQLVSYAVK